MLLREFFHGYGICNNGCSLMEKNALARSTICRDCYLCVYYPQREAKDRVPGEAQVVRFLICRIPIRTSGTLFTFGAATLDVSRSLSSLVVRILYIVARILFLKIFELPPLHAKCINFRSFFDEIGDFMYV